MATRCRGELPASWLRPEEIGAFSVGGTKFALKPGPGNDLPPSDDFAIGFTGDLRVREIATP